MEKHEKSFYSYLVFMCSIVICYIVWQLSSCCIDYSNDQTEYQKGYAEGRLEKK